MFTRSEAANISFDSENCRVRCTRQFLIEELNIWSAVISER